MGALTDKIKGTAKRIEGRLTGDKVRTAQGTAEKTKGTVEGAASRGARSVKAGVRRAKAKVQRASRRRPAGDL
ncbi:MAG TPA: hypothetical protein VGD37_43210 [Kofleriaceae bacterium]|jgi:uncharacterized protein YjbJ (UPF0337 family)